MPFTVKIDASGFIAARRLLEQKQLPFALASTLTAVAQDSQAGVKRNVRQAFKLRNNWTERGIRIEPARATERMIQAAVYTDTANRATGAPDYLGRQEEGGERIPYGGRHFIAIPTKALRALAPNSIPNEMRPKNLLSASAGRFLYTGRKGQLVNGRQRIVKGLVFFINQMKNGHYAILARPANEKNARNVVPFYLLVPEAHIRQSQLRMVDTVTKIANVRFERQWEQTWRRIYANGIRI